jgi:hypothetical protein
MIRRIGPRYAVILILITITLGLLGASQFDRRSPMKRPLVYLVPEKYAGPVFVFFGQKDGVETFADTLGNAVNVPRNGIIKLKGSVDDLIHDLGENSRNVYWVQVSHAHGRKLMIFNHNSELSDDGETYDSYVDEFSKVHVYRHRPDEKSDPFFYFSEQKKRERMIFGHGGCKHQRFAPADAADSALPDCGKFLVIAPAEYFQMRHWLWGETTGEYTSIQELETEANERAAKIEQFYK